MEQPVKRCPMMNPEGYCVISGRDGNLKLCKNIAVCINLKRGVTEYGVKR
jgi:hypothetical protein